MPYKDPDRQREYARLWAAERRRAFFEGKCCLKCGSVQRLEIDHIDPAHKESHRIFSWSKKKFDVEIAKCQVLCKDCHLDKTRKFISSINSRPVQHGTLTAYRNYKCRCEQCLEARRASRRKRKERLGYWN